jgi:transcriptional regulator with PAS, ATPase and Fis domain
MGSVQPAYHYSPMKVLLTFTGFHDPYSPGLIGETELQGPILSLLQVRSFDLVSLFSTPNTEAITRHTEKAIRSRHPGVEVAIHHLFLDDPTDYRQILKNLRLELPRILDATPKAEFSIAVASGTPQMHACWLLLAASGEIPARLLHIRPARFVTRRQPLVSEIDLGSHDLPQIRARPTRVEKRGNESIDIQAIVAQSGIIGDHPTIRRAVEIALSLAPTPVPILIQGETGTGKELFARLIHRASSRPVEHFAILNCAAIPGELVESLLFGHKKGSFTGATADQEGKFDLADGGTLFLDELGELPLPAQAKLLRVLQDGLVEPVGERKPHRVNVRVIAATNRSLKRAIRDGRFREDLFYRLNVGEIDLPPLRERRSDIPPIALQILDRLNASLRSPKRLSVDALRRLQMHSWPGNVRDLQNVLERSVLLSSKEVLEADDLLLPEPESGNDPWSALPEPREGFEMESFLSGARKQLLLRALEIAGGNQSRAANLLGITPQAVHKFLRANR